MHDIYALYIDAVTHACIVNLTTISLEYGLMPGKRQAIKWINSALLSIATIRTNFSEIKKFHSGECNWKRRLENDSHFVPASLC